MIDWISMLVPCRHSVPITGGRVLSVSADGETEWESLKRMSIRGSFDSRLAVRTATHTSEQCTHVEISGNPVKFFQGHNLWGSDDIHGIAVEAIEHLVGVADIGLLPTVEDRQCWSSGDIGITRVDQTLTWHLGSLSDVLAWIRAAENTAHLSHRGRGQLVKGSTLYFGKNSRRWSIKLYAKGQEISAKGHGQESILELPAARHWADKSLRAELTLRSMELKRLQLDRLSAWRAVDGVDFVGTGQLLLERLGNMTMTTISSLPAHELDTLRPAIRLAYQAWETGSDLRALLSTRTFYRYRAELLPMGIDIATVKPSQAGNVVPLIRFLEAVPAVVPDWAMGTSLYWEPRRVA